MSEKEPEVKEITSEIGDTELVYVPYEIFKQSMDINTENLKQLYGMLHQLNMQKSFSIEVDMGGIKFAISGSENDSKNVTKAADALIEKFMKKLFSKADLLKALKEIERKDTDVKKGYN